MKRFFAVLLILAVLLFASYSFASEIKYAGSITILEGVMKEAAEVFEKQTGVKVGLSGGGSGAGIKAVISGLVDFGGVSRDLKEEEIKQGINSYTIGWGAVGLIANKGVPIENLTSRQIKEILTGKIKNWKAVGGPDLQIKVVISTPGCACREEFQELIMDKEPYTSDAVVSPMKTLSDTVKGIPGAVGPLATAVIDTEKVKIIKVDGVGPSSENVKNKKYKASRQINLITKGQAQGKVKEFIDFMLSPKGQALVEKNFVKIK